MNRTIIKALLFVILLQITSSASAEIIFLKDGNILEGKIVSDTADYVMLKTKTGNEKIQRKNIMRTLYAGLNRAKLYVQKRDGGSFTGFLVDEDRDVYIFRKELNKVEEFSVTKKEVLFMSEKNPSALKGEAASDSISLTWLPPYGQVKNNKIYMKQKKEDEYRVIGTTKKNNITISGLESQKTYFFIVRAIDDTGDETNPSNEIQVITKSIPPDSPDVKAEKDEKENWVLIWSETKDDDGKVEGYRIYTERNGEYALLEETKKFTAVVPKDAVFDSIHVRSVDNNGDESKTIDYRNDWRFILSPQYMIPMGKMTDFAGNGYGACLDVSRRGIFTDNFEIGLTGGYLDVEGKQKIGAGNSNVTSLVMYPGAMFFAWRIPVSFNRFGFYDVFSLYPKLSGGLITMQFEYDLLDKTGAVDESKKTMVLEPFVKAGLFAELGVSRNFFFTAGCEYSYMIDTIQGMGLVNISASAGFRF